MYKELNRQIPYYDFYHTYQYPYLPIVPYGPHCFDQCYLQTGNWDYCNNICKIPTVTMPSGYPYSTHLYPAGGLPPHGTYQCYTHCIEKFGDPVMCWNDCFTYPK